MGAVSRLFHESDEREIGMTGNREQATIWLRGRFGVFDHVDALTRLLDQVTALARLHEARNAYWLWKESYEDFGPKQDKHIRELSELGPPLTECEPERSK